ncbi:MAG TPA: SPW repeat protein [Stellaceae bacterium]|nr:SPW repeat protein [Stellaceae bacterium]
MSKTHAEVGATCAEAARVQDFWRRRGVSASKDAAGSAMVTQAPKRIVMDDKQHWQDWANYFLGLSIFGSPWLLVHSMVTEVPGSGSRAMWNLWVVGLAVVVVSTVALNAFRVWEEWVNFGLGVWLALSPWILDSTASAMLMWPSVFFGALIFSIAGWALTEDPRRKIERGQKTSPPR